MKTQMLSTESREVTKLVFSNDQLKEISWEENTEFSYQDEMYDVIKLEKSNGKTIIWCLADKKETALVGQYLKSRKQSSEKNGSDQILKLLTTQFLPSTQKDFIVPLQLQQQIFNLYQLSIPAIANAIITPPPKVC